MRHSRRQFFKWGLEALGAAGVLALGARPAQACLYGTWFVKCPYDGQVDRVDDGTCQHICSRDAKQVFDGSKVTVMCPNNHPNAVETGKLMQSWKCTVCN